MVVLWGVNFYIFCLKKNKQQNLSLMPCVERFEIKSFLRFISEVYLFINIYICFYFRNMVLAERCVLLSAEILKSQSKYSEAAALLIRLTSEVKLSSFFNFCPLTICFSYPNTSRLPSDSCPTIFSNQR